MTQTGVYTGERVIDKIPIKTLLLGYNEEEGKVLDFLRENKEYAYSIKEINRCVFNNELKYGECQQYLKKLADKGVVHRHMFINVIYYFNKY